MQQTESTAICRESLARGPPARRSQHSFPATTAPGGWAPSIFPGATMRVCPINHCGRPIENMKFACLTHWRQLTRDQQHTILDAWDSYIRDEITIDELRQVQQSVVDAVSAANL